jgi:hypothetical protein
VRTGALPDIAARETAFRAEERRGNRRPRNKKADQDHLNQTTSTHEKKKQ